MMKHLEARDLLLDLAEGSLEARVRTDVEAHVAACDDCDSWLGTYSLIESAAAARAAHPSADSIAAYALEPAGLPSSERGVVAAHLEQCKSCSREYRMTRQAYDDARPDATARQALNEDWFNARRRRPQLAAAGLVAAVLLVALVVGRPQPGSQSTETGVASSDPQIVESAERLYANDLQLTGFSDLELHAPQGVVLGDGFAVHRGARLSISTGQSFGDRR